ncbi:hypothetical protein J2128_001234 [Methanomicrobium sp. W14]|uniref:hypothetical protein n=1 Tax=Methanomicrobium sp. W14 TaxID=2817839 RepID=UPI001AE91C71|nr:hypothetical protein [Methanomicrobium sp. W14]MBP2133280.1 hypothetical protein [Methanomicrobium sp. W14]
MVKRFGILSVVFIAILFAAVLASGCTGTTDNATPSPTQTEVTPAENETATPVASETAEQTAQPTETDNITMSYTTLLVGEGPQNDTVRLPEGVSMFTLTQDTPDESSVSIDTEKDGIYISNSYNESVRNSSMKGGKYYWTYAFSLENASSANISVKTDSNWTLEFEFPQVINGIVPQTFSGTATKVTPFFQINEGEYNFTINAENNRLISVSLMDYYGNVILDDNREMPLAFMEGPYNGTVTMKINESNNYLMNVLCDGNWTVSVEQA